MSNRLKDITCMLLRLKKWQARLIAEHTFCIAGEEIKESTQDYQEVKLFEDIEQLTLAFISNKIRELSAELKGIERKILAAKSGPANSKIKTYVKNALAIRAMQFTGENLKECEQFIGKENYDNTLNYPNIRTLEGTMAVSDSDYIIQGTAGEFYPCRESIFEAIYTAQELNIVLEKVETD